MRQIECLRCGEIRRRGSVGPPCAAADECPRCGYVGWAPSTDLTEPARRVLRERPPERRRLVAVW